VLTQLPTINVLKQPTSSAWVEQAMPAAGYAYANLDIILLDHSHCERKAAGVALNMMFRYPSNTKMVRELTAIAREELEHFELVNQWLERRNIPLAHLPPPPYGAGLRVSKILSGVNGIRSASLRYILGFSCYLFRQRNSHATA
jgi:tRNA 2-(methylsulfanyl)-N6-isopentenyladenosine37 hydroxylase